MDDRRFDTLTRVLTTGVPRRRVGLGIATGLAAILPSLVRRDDARAKSRRKKKKRPQPAHQPGCPPCGDCRECRNGSCVPVADNTLCGQCGRCLNGACAIAVDRASGCGQCARCEAGACVNKPSETACDEILCPTPGGICYSGLCHEGGCYTPPAPYCREPTGPCQVHADCCSGVCCQLFGYEVRFCCQSNPGGLCLTDGDCVAGASCVAYRCYT